MRVTRATALAGLLSFLTSFASAQPAPPLIKEGVTVKVSSHVYAIPDGNVGLVPNVGIIVGTNATMVVDTGLGPRNGRTVLKELAKVSSNAELYVATTHYHPEHSLGGAAFPPTAKFVRPNVQQQEMQELGKGLQDTFAGFSALHQELLAGVPYPRADILFDREHRIDLGGVHVRLLARGPMHTRGDTMIVVEEDRVLFSGDVVMSNAFLAASPTSSLRTWLATLDELDALRPTVVVPSHGVIGDSVLIGRARDYLRIVQLRVAELKAQGKTADEVATMVTSEIPPRFPDWTVPARVGAAGRAAYSEAR